MIPEKSRSPQTLLRAGGLRSTAPRRVILECVRATDRHPTAAWVYRRVRRRIPRVSLGTVYRNLRTLVDAGLLVERPDPAGSRFDGNTAAHHHFTCVRCRRVYDLSEPADCVVDARITRRSGFEVVQQRIEFLGRCPTCSAPRRRRTRWQARV
jgi:Fe2+ or Zn2+ uptake regulation protein